MLDLLAGLSADDTAIVVAIVGMRLLLPLLIPRFPLIIVAALVVDAVDRTILQQLTTLDTSESVSSPI